MAGLSIRHAHDGCGGVPRNDSATKGDSSVGRWTAFSAWFSGRQLAGKAGRRIGRLQGRTGDRYCPSGRVADILIWPEFGPVRKRAQTRACHNLGVTQ